MRSTGEQDVGAERLGCLRGVAFELRHEVFESLRRLTDSVAVPSARVAVEHLDVELIRAVGTPATSRSRRYGDSRRSRLTPSLRPRSLTYRGAGVRRRARRLARP